MILSKKYQYISLLYLIPFIFAFTIAGCEEQINKKTPAGVFTNVTKSAGLGKTGASFDNPVWGDINNDGYPDLFIQHHLGKLAMYQNDRNGKFDNVINSSGIMPIAGKDRHGISWGDYDNDGNLDLFITDGTCRGHCLGNKSDELWKGDGKGNFTNITASAGVTNGTGRGRSAFWVDYNKDGLLDLFILNYETNSILFKNNGDGTFTDVTTETGLSNISGQVCSWADYNNDGYMDILFTGVDNSRLFKNNPATNKFVEVTSEAGLLKVAGMGISWGDYNNDGYMDLYISRGLEEIRNTLLWNSSAIFFKDEEELSDGISFSTKGISITFELYIDNKDTASPSDIYIGGGRVNPASVPFTISINDPSLTGTPAFIPGTVKGFFIWKDESNLLHVQYSSNGDATVFYGKITSNGIFETVSPTFNTVHYDFKDTLYKNNGDGTFTDITASAGVESSGNHLTSLWGDYDNDGFLDLYVVNTGDISGAGANILFKNNGDGTFTDVAAAAGIDASDVYSRHFGAAWGDYNNDGFLDIILKNGVGEKYPFASGPDVLYKNNGNNSNHWLKLKLVGTYSNRLGIGARIILNADGKTQYREMNGGGGGELHSQGSGPVHFGTGTADLIDSLTIKWPSGTVQTLTNIKADQTITVIEE